MVDFPPRRKRPERYLPLRHPRSQWLLTKVVGSMADVPKDLLEQIKELERLFTVDQPKLKEVTDHFVKELEKGKSISEASVRCLVLMPG